MNSFFLRCSLPPNTEGSAEPCEAIGASVRTQVKTILPCLLTLTPFVISADTLAKGKASHTLLQRRFAPRKVVRLLPDKRGRLTVSILFSIILYIKEQACACPCFCPVLENDFSPVPDIFLFFLYPLYRDTPSRFP